MEFYGLTFSEYTKFDVIDVEDYHVKGSFDPQASCDTEFYGYRETTFEIQSAQGKDAIGWWEFDVDELRHFKEVSNDRITLIVQDAIDKQNGEYDG